MIRFEYTEVYGFDAAIRGMRNPMNSWEKSDSCFFNNYDEGCKDFIVGENDLRLMKTLGNAGPDHGKYLRMIGVSVDITAPLYWWKEFDTYKVGTVANSCSTMHKIHAKEFTLDDFSYEHLTSGGLAALKYIIERLNTSRNFYLREKDKDYWWDMIQLLPTSYNQKRTVTLNYAVLKNIYHARKHHKLDEWSVGFCEWVETLPHSELITGGE